MDAGHEALQAGRELPLDLARHIQRAEAGPRRDDGAEVPQGIVYGRDAASVAWMSDLSDEERAGSVGDVGSETHYEATGKIHGVPAGRICLLRKTLKQGSEDDEKAADGGSLLPTEAVSYVRRKQEDEKATEAGKGAEDAKSVTRRMIKDYLHQRVSQFTISNIPPAGLTCLPGVHCLKSIEETAVVAKGC